MSAMSFLQTVTLVKMLPRGFKHFEARVFHRFMVMAMLLLCSAQASESGDNNSGDSSDDSSPSFTKNGNRKKIACWILAAILAIAALIAGFSVDFNWGDVGGASQFLQCTVIGIGFALLANSITQVFVLGVTHNLSTKAEADGSYTEEDTKIWEETEKLSKDITQWFGMLLALATIILAFVSLQGSGDGLLIGKSMTFCSLLGMGLLAGFFIKYNYTADTTSGLVLSKLGTCTKCAGTTVSGVITRGKQMWEEDKRSFSRFFLDSKSFWFSIACIIMLICACSLGDFEGNSMILKVATIITTGTFLICASYIGYKRYGVYKKGDSQSHWEISKNKNTEQIGKHLIPTAFVGIGVAGLILLVVAILGGHFAGSGTMSIATVFVTLFIGVYGFVRTGPGMSSKDGLLEYCKYEGPPVEEAKSESVRQEEDGGHNIRRRCLVTLRQIAAASSPVTSL